MLTLVGMADFTTSISWNQLEVIIIHTELSTTVHINFVGPEMLQLDGKFMAYVHGTVAHYVIVCDVQLAYCLACNSCKTLIGEHEMHGRMHPN